MPWGDLARVLLPTLRTLLELGVEPDDSDPDVCEAIVAS
jgi:hypothetical protein